MEVVKTWEAISFVKNGMVGHIVKEIGHRTIDVSEDRISVFAVEHHCYEGLWGILNTISADGFTMGGDGVMLPWKDMIVEDLAMVLDYLRCGHW